MFHRWLPRAVRFLVTALVLLGLSQRAHAQDKALVVRAVSSSQTAWTNFVKDRLRETGLFSTVDDIDMGEALERDRLSRPLPVWRGCRVVAPSELFLMNWQVRDSLDGRYFGPLPAASVMGRATPLYTNEDGDGRFVWRAPTR